MKKFKSKLLFCILPLFVFIAAIALGMNFKDAGSASADYYYPSTYLSGYDVVYNIKSDRTISVTEDITVYHAGNTGFIRDIPVNGGEKVQNVKVYAVDSDGKTKSVYYDVFVEDSRFISIDIGDYYAKRGNYTYRITYDYCMAKSQEGENALALTPIGGGWNCKIENITVKLILPEGYIDGSVNCFTMIGTNDTGTVETTTTTQDGRTVISANLEKIDGLNNECLRFDLTFEEGALTTYFDFTPYIFVIVAVVILLLTLAVKFLFFNKQKLVPIVNFEAPQKMDPLIMGKLIDNKVNSEDITSMIFYWADKGYLKINLEDKNDPVLIRTVKFLPEGTPAYEVTLFNEMFDGRDVIKPSDLKYSFYKTVERVTRMVNVRAKGLYDSKSIGVSVLFAILGVLLLGLAPLILAMTQISTTYLIIAPFISIIPLLFVYALSETVKYNGLKYNKTKKLLLSVGVAVIASVFTLFYTLLVPSSVISVVPKILLCVISCATVACSVLIISRTKSYTEQLNDIVGFRNFITLTEKDRLEKMLEDDPQFYYHVLPYAQVLGVSDIWENKFADITVEPPRWMTNSALGTIFEFHLFNSIIRQSTSRMSSNMISRPSSSGVSGGHGGSFGGFSGGGHGGGGGRFR